MPHFVTFDRFASKFVVHPEFKPETDGISGLHTDQVTGDGSDQLMGMTTDLSEDQLTGIDLAMERFAPGSAVDSLGGTSRVGYSEVELKYINDAGTQGSVWEAASDTWSPTPVRAIGATCTPTCGTGFAEDALVQQVNGTLGYEMHPANDLGSADHRW